MNRSCRSAGAFFDFTDFSDREIAEEESLILFWASRASEMTRDVSLHST
jgi:hypothetical protein